MKRDTYAKMYSKAVYEHNEKKKTLSKWTKLVKRYKKDAPAELCVLLGKEDHSAQVIDIHTSVALVSKTTDTLLLYPMLEGMRFGHKAEIYHFEDKTRWPWTVANALAPLLSRDVYSVILKHLRPIDMISLSQVCRAANRAAKLETLWDKRRQWLYTNIVCSRQLLDRMPTWQLYAHLVAFLGCYGAKDPAMSYSDNDIVGAPEGSLMLDLARLALNCYYPLGERVGITPPNHPHQILYGLANNERDARCHLHIHIGAGLMFGMTIASRGRRAFTTVGYHLSKYSGSRAIDLTVKAFESLTSDTSEYGIPQKWMLDGVTMDIRRLLGNPTFPRLHKFLKQ